LTQIFSVYETLAALVGASPVMHWRDPWRYPTGKVRSRFPGDAYRLWERTGGGWEAAFERGKSYRDVALREVGPVLTPVEVAARLGVSAVTVNNWRRRKRLLAFRFDEHKYL
jgi:hypothetical protein